MLGFFSTSQSHAFCIPSFGRGMGLDVVGPLYATKTEFGTKFREMVATEGVPAAVRWRAAQF
jgi:hypothetical protein